jgi:hypothetical protein
MRYARGSKAGTAAATTTFDLSTELESVRVPSEKIIDDVYEVADFDIEVVGNDAEVTLAAVGPFSTSTALSVTDGTFAIGGGKILVSGFAFGSLEFTTSGGAYTINIIRRIDEL